MRGQPGNVPAGSRRNPKYWDRGKPYLDGYRALFIRDDTAQVSAISSGRAPIQFRGFSPAQRDDIVRALGENVTVRRARGTARS